MNPTWRSEDLPVDPSVGVAGWGRALGRGVPMAIVVFGGLAVLLLLRLIERPISGLRRPVTPYITQGVCKTVFWLIGLDRRVHGRPMKNDGALVANHSSWLDIFALNATDRIYFVSKSEVASWPAIGWLARATGTLFIRRNRKEAHAQNKLFERRLKAGHRLLFFPEGTSSDGARVLPFKATLFQAFFADGLHEKIWIQPVSILYHAPPGEDPRFYGWWGDMDFGSHLLKVLATRKNGAVDVFFHDPVAVKDFDNRKALAACCEEKVRSVFRESAAADAHPDAAIASDQS